jgi:acyl-CoA synthetase (AMP-forming)/AMP-acid ligase II
LACQWAHAQSSVTLYGVVDESIRYITHANKAGDSTFSLGNGGMTQSRWGLKGVEDLGDGWTTFFKLENRFLINSGQSDPTMPYFNEAQVGVRSSSYGQVIIGRQYNVMIEGITVAGYGSNPWIPYDYTFQPEVTMTGGIWTSNQVQYQFKGRDFMVATGYAFGNVAGHMSYGSEMGIAAAYAPVNGPFTLGGAYKEAKDTINGSDSKAWTFGGSYTWDKTRFSAGYIVDRNDPGFSTFANGPFTAPALTALKYTDFSRRRIGEALTQGARSGFTPVSISAGDVAVLQYTGGTTGVSKGATLLHRNLLANVLQSEAWREPVTRDRPDIEQFVTVVALPLYHIFGLTVCAFMTMRTGGLGILIPNPRDIPAMINALTGFAINSLPAVNTLYNALMSDPDFGKLDFSKLLIANGGGMAVQQAVAAQWLERTGKPIIEGYGLSETSPCATSNPSNGTTFTGTVGVPLPSTCVSIRDDHGRPVARGEPGEICISGPQVMAGYWNRPDETAKATTADGFFKSGDIGVMDERGFVRIVDRKKDMVNVSGFNVYPNEIEDVVAMHPGVFEVAAVGVSDAHSGEAVKLFVVRRDSGLTEADLLAFCKERLTGYKRPKTIEFRAELPKSNVGKILRRKLREHAD